MNKNTGYREMLRDRCPKVVNFALKYCKVKEAWLDHVYKNFIWLYSDNNERLNATKTVLGIKETYIRGKKKTVMNFKFEDTICWDNLTSDEEKKWKSISRWVSWFQLRYAYIEDLYRNSKQKGVDLREIKYDIMIKYLDFMCPTAKDSTEERQKKNENINNLVDYLIDCFEDKI